MEAEPVFRAAGEGKHVFGMRACITVKLAAEDVEDRRCSVMELLAPAEFGPPLHIHHEEDELIQLLEGRVRVARRGHDAGASRTRRRDRKCEGPPTHGSFPPQ